jgi:AraC-like DNA-binding protein
MVNSFCTIAFLTCTIIGLIHYFVTGRQKPREHILSVSVGFALVSVAYGIVLTRALMPAIIPQLYILYLLLLLLSAVFLYRFLWLMTGTGHKESFSPWHFMMPFVLTMILGAWTASNISTKRRFELAIGPDVLQPNMPPVEVVYMFLPFLFTTYIVLYAIASFVRTRRYRLMVVDYSANEERTAISWIYYYIFLILLGGFATFLRFSYHWPGAPRYLFLLVVVFPVGEVVLLYNIIKGNYVLVEPAPSLPDAVKLLARREQVLDRQRFDSYMTDKKPYLNPELCITDMTADLITNRTYLSNFINKEYGMNFRTLVNTYRLRELERLRRAPEYAHLDNMDIIMRAGFSSYRSYLSAEKHEYRKQQLPFGK